MSDTQIPTIGGLPPNPSGSQPDDPPREGRALIDAAADGEALTPREGGALLDYFLANGDLPGDEETMTIEVSIGRARKQTYKFELAAIEWADWQDARKRATDDDTGTLDTYVMASWVVARALRSPKLGAHVAQLQAENADTAPNDAADLLRRMFRKQSGTLLEINGKVLEHSNLAGNTLAVREIDAAKN